MLDLPELNRTLAIPWVFLDQKETQDIVPVPVFSSISSLFQRALYTIAVVPLASISGLILYYPNVSQRRPLFFAVRGRISIQLIACTNQPISNFVPIQFLLYHCSVDRMTRKERATSRQTHLPLVSPALSIVSLPCSGSFRPGCQQSLQLQYHRLHQYSCHSQGCWARFSGLSSYPKDSACHYRGGVDLAPRYAVEV